MHAFGIRPLSFCIVLLSVAFGSALAAGNRDPVIYEGTFDVGALKWVQDRDGAQYPMLGDLRGIDDPGQPRLPMRSLLLLVPADANITGAWIEPLGTHRLAARPPVALAEPLVSDTGEFIRTSRLESGGASFPEAWGRFAGTHTWRGYRLLALDVYPLRQISEAGATSVEFLDSYAVRVQYGRSGAATDMLQRERLVDSEHATNSGVLASLVANPERIASYARVDGAAIVDEAAGGFQPDKTPSLSGSAVSYLIVTNEALKPAFTTLAQFKTAQGIPTVVATREYIEANFRSGADFQETLRMFIRDAYAKWGVDYVLLGGDSDILPPRYVINNFYPVNGSTSIPCDLYFACLDGNWNADGDSFFGEPARTGIVGDLADFAEEVYLGRAPVSTLAAATVFVNKMISYESTAAGATWPKRTLFAAEVLFPEAYVFPNIPLLDGAQFADQQVNSHIIPCTDMQYTRMYETDVVYPRDAPLTRAALIDTLNAGRHGIFNQIGHGYYFNMSVGDANFMTTDADNLVNGSRLFLIYALNCASAAFDNSCLMERLVQNPNGGSICSIGSVRAAFPNNANAYQQEFFRVLYCTSERRAGRLMALSRLPFLGQTGTNTVDRWTFENYTMLGDPTLPVWTGSPRTVAIAGPGSLSVGPQTVVLNVTVGGSPVAGALVCLTKTGEDHVFGETDALGQVSLAFMPVSPGTATIVITGRDLAQRSLSLPVSAAVAYLSAETVTVLDNGADGSVGNGDGFVDAGETLALRPVLRENAGFAASGITSTVSCADAGVTVITPSASFAPAAAGGSTAALTAMKISIAGNVADGTTITLRFDTLSGANHSFSEWPLTVRAPQLEVVAVDWDDVDWGNGNGGLETGERLGLNVVLKNFGSGASGTVTGRLRTSSPYVTLFDTLSTWSSLGLLGTGSGAANFSMAIDVTRNNDAWILFVDGYGRTLRHDFTLQRPDTPLNITTDTSLGADIITLSWNPSLATDIYGYNVYRSLSAGGPFVRANPDVIAGVSYFADTGLAQLTTYYYKVESVDTSRVPSSLSSVISRNTAPAEATGFPVSFTSETSSPLAVGDVDGDGGLDIVVASNQVFVWRHNGMELRDGDANSQTLGNFTNLAVGAVLQPAAVTLADLDGIPGQEMIVSQRAPSSLIHVYTKTGSELPGWPKSLIGTYGSTWNWAAPAVGDIDGDGAPEIVVNTLDGIVWAWNADGTEVRDGDSNPATNGVFYVRAGAQWEWSRSGPTLCDLDGDGALDIIFGTKNDSTGLRRLMALRYDGSNVAGFPYIAYGAINGDVVVGDLDSDGILEIVFYCKANYVYAVRQNGTNYPGFPKATGLTAGDFMVGTPALGDLDGDGWLDIVYSPNQTGLIGKLAAISTNYTAGTSGQFLAGWPVTLPGSSEGSPVIGDIDGDGSPEIVHGIGGGNEASPYNLYAFHANGQAMVGFPITLKGPLMPGVTITDLDRDGDVDMVYAGWDFLCHVWDMPFAYDRHNVPWPTFKGNMQRTGVYFPIALVGVGEAPALPKSALQLDRPYPNPFNPSTKFSLYLAETGDLEVNIYDLQGRLVRSLHTGPIGAGWHAMVWDGRDNAGRGQSSGVYFVRARSAADESVQKMTLMK